jgi:hypothetical protein
MGRYALGPTCADSTSATSGPHAHVWESNGTWAAWYKRRGVPPRVNSMLVQQEEHHPGGQRKNNHHVFQEGTQGLILDPQARHEEFQDV